VVKEAGRGVFISKEFLTEEIICQDQNKKGKKRPPKERTGKPGSVDQMKERRTTEDEAK